MSGFVDASTLTHDADGARLDLATALGATPQGLVEHPVFFTGFLARPDVAAAGLLTVADVAMARYADAGLAKRLANLDPIVTASGDRLRFESFSACNGVHARFDLLADGIEAGAVAFGTTNVDVNQPLRSALARIGRADLLHLAVGTDSLTASSLAESHVERKVGLPDRWVRGCAEVPVLTEAMRPVTTLKGAAVTRFLGELPSVAPPGPTLHLVRVGAAVRTTAHAVPGAVPITGTSRLRAAGRIARFATELHVFAGPSDSSGWVFEVPGGRLTLVLSPGPFRGFSGEGGLLGLLVGPGAEALGERLLDHLAWTPHVNEAQLADASGLGRGEVRTGLAWLAACGRVGHDLAENARFHRDLPVDSARVLRRNPRLAGARRLVDAGAVRQDQDGWQVRGDHGTYIVTGDRCTCPWEAEHSGTRGPCKHVLAVAMVLDSAARG